MTAASVQGDIGVDSPLVGRKAVLEELLEILRNVRKGKVSTVVLTGPTGSGKTAVLESFLEHCRTGVRGVRVLSAMGDEWEAQFALAGYSQLMLTTPLRSAKAYDGGPHLPAAPVASLGADQMVNYASTLSTHLEGLQQHGAVVVAADDVHKLDVESLRILTFVMRRLHGKRVFFLLTLNPADAPRIPAGVLDFLTGHQVTRIPMEPITPREVQEVARRLYGIDLSVTAAHGLVRHTGGLPRPVVELLGELPPETWLAWFPALPPTSRLRARVRSVLAAASPGLVAVAEAVSVLGRSAGLAEVAAVGGVGSVFEALDEGHRAGLLRLSVEQARSAVVFVEPGTAEAVYEQIIPSRRIDLHRRAAEAVEAEGEKLGHRVSATPAADQALAGELEDFAGRQAAVGAWQDVATALFSASRLSLEIRARNDRLLRAVDALVGAGNVAEAQTWSAAVDALPPSPLRSSVLGYLSTVSGQSDSAQSQLEMAWRTSNPEREPRAAAQVAQRFVLHGVASWDGPMITGWAERAMSLTEPGTPAHVESEAIYGLGLYARGQLGEAQASYQRAFGHAAENAQKQRVQMGAGWLALRMDNVESALANFESAAPTEYRGGSLRISLWAEAWLARTHLVLGNWDAAEATIARSSVRLETSRMPLIRPLLYWTAAELWSMRGDWDRARYYVSQAAVQPGTYRAMQVPASLARARFHEARADYESALAVLQPLTELDPWTDDRVSFWPWQDTYINALVMTDQLDTADQFLTSFEGLRREREVPSDMARMAWARGRLLAAQGDPDAAREHFEAALGHLRGLNRPYLRARISFAFGQSMRRAGKRRLASSVLRAARDLYDSLGAATYVERCDRELKATGLDVGHLPDPADPVLTAARDHHIQLTAQEQAVAELVAGGATNKEAARALFLAEKTVQYHLTRLYRKMGIRSRSELAAAFRAGD
ncbi:helix-turn-helix transcriptional regulator [Pseudarthrobacter phenanthrenivorans]|uniref:Helix-turn-helix transcriptional regulator n=1 Tax=Pseudarthrobacter phenanthrenivorans TaxID=361575 RepID=A0A3B0FXE0_PSEPS|nr:LuxR family transcriptional regulator [Pseudarthrobacter phenanthrenivorans]RKO27553.1 helix-turn-helix transcriptional regulator [Pseudarthrobacter phenanthrenivorans]